MSVKDIGDWTCEGQGDLTDLVDVEHIPGSMPAGDAERDAARDAFYQWLLDGNGPGQART